MMASSLLLLAALIAGAVIGAAHFVLLERAVLAMARDLRPASGLPFHVARIALAAGGYWMLARIGAGALLCGLAGFQAARGWAVRREVRG
jgi:hypothetical protein